jgi:hypothetical protein
MLRLDIPHEAFWVECPYGVRLLCRPLTTAMNHAAMARAARRLRELGLDGADEDIRRGHLVAEVLAALAELLVVEWQGVGDAAGAAPAPLSPEGLRALMSVPEIATAFNEGISAPLARLAAEGNA